MKLITTSVFGEMVPTGVVTGDKVGKIWRIMVAELRLHPLS